MSQILTKKFSSSSFIAELAYSPADQMLSVRFRDETEAHYEEVPQDEAVAFMESKSHGSFFNTRIKSVYQEVQTA